MGGKPRTRTRYTVVFDKERKCIVDVTGRTDNLEWTYDREHADKLARWLGGRVVDADEWAKNPVFLES